MTYSQPDDRKFELLKKTLAQAKANTQWVQWKHGRTRLTFAMYSELGQLFSVEHVPKIQLDNIRMISIVKYLEGNSLLNNQLGAQKVRARAMRYLIEGKP